MELQAVYSMSKNVYNLVLALTGPDPEAVAGGLSTAYTRNHALAATIARHGITVNWKPWLKPEKVIRVTKTGTEIRDTLGVLLATVEIDPDSPLGIRTDWVSPDIQADIEKTRKEELNAR